MKRLLLGGLIALSLSLGLAFTGNGSTVGQGAATVEAAEASAACVNGWEWIPHYRLVTHYDEYGSYQTYDFWYWEVRRCSMWF